MGQRIRIVGQSLFRKHLMRTASARAIAAVEFPEYVKQLREKHRRAVSLKVS